MFSNKRSKATTKNTNGAPEFLRSGSKRERECVIKRDKKAYNKHDTPHTGWAKGAPSEDCTTPPSSRTASSSRFVWGTPAGVRPFDSGVANPPAPGSHSHTLVWSHNLWEQTAIPGYPPVKVTCARMSSNRVAVCACIRRLKRVAAIGAHAAPVFLGISGFAQVVYPE